MKKNGRTSTALVFPGASGWRVRLPNGLTTSAPALDEVAAALPAGALVHLALPCHEAVLERMTLPSLDREELSGMVQLQLEKLLPYGVEEASSDFDVIKQEESESTLLTVTAKSANLDRLCEPLRLKALMPQKVTVYAQHVAATCSRDETVLCAWPEDGQLVLAICEHGKLGYAQTLPATDPVEVLAELPGVLLRAEMEGVPTNFTRVRIEQGCAGLRDQLGELLEKPVEVFSFDDPLPDPSTNLVPASWVAEQQRMQSGTQLRARLQVVAMLALVGIALAFLYLAWLKRQVQMLDVQIAQTQPLVEFQQSRQAKWLELAPAIDPNRFAVEILDRLVSNRPNDEVKFTLFEFGPKQFKVECEATSADQWNAFKEKLRKDPGLTSFTVDSQPPQVLNDGHVKFTIFGR